jgi:hemerythrin-like domain-containing protein
VKRTEALKQLSRDHHRALEAALKLKRAGDDDKDSVVRAFLEFWRDHGSAHFRVEEEVLLPGVEPEVPPTDERVVRVLTDHVEIRRRALSLEDGHDVSAAELNQLGRMLTEHVRHEERVLFPLIEDRLDADALAELADAVEAAERTPGK